MKFFEIQQQLDQYYQTNQMEQAYEFMIEQLQNAMNCEDDILVLMLLSELIGYDRVTARFDEGNMLVEQILKIIEVRNLQETIHAATSYVNIATFYRVQGKYQESLVFYQKAHALYQLLLNEDDERYCAYYNNISLLYQEIGDYSLALENELKALKLISLSENCEIECAITYTNLSQMYFGMNDMTNGYECLKKGINLFENYGVNDPHYYAALSSLAQYYYLNKDFQKAIDIYDDVLNKIENVYGKNKDYQTVLLNKNKVEEEMQKPIKGMEICHRYYEQYGKKMIEEQFSKYQKYMAIGLFGYGSECLGYDDLISRDHDFGSGFCIFLPKNIFDEIGDKLQEAYSCLPQEFMGIQRKISIHGQGRVGVFEIESFFQQFLNSIPKTLNDWLYVDENALLACTNGCIFDDYYGHVTEIRNYLSYYPEQIRINKIINSIAKMAQSGQYNYARCMKRHDEVAAGLALNEFIDQTMSLIYLLNKKYKPYYKWSYYGLKDCKILKDIQPFIHELMVLPMQNQEKYIDTQDQKVVLIEKICQRVIFELKRQVLTDSDDDFLDSHAMNMIKLLHIEKS